MKLRVRGPSGQSTLEIPETALISDLKARISEATSLTVFDLKYGYPPKPLDLDQHPGATQLSDLGIRLNGEQLTVSAKFDGEDALPAKPIANSSSSTKPKVQIRHPSPTTSDASQTRPLSLSRKAPPVDAPELPLPGLASTLVMRIMPDDNSCLFRAFSTAFFGTELDSMHELRSIIAQVIQADPDTYSEVVLEQTPDDYCRWIQTDEAWGGAIELTILSKHFNVEICSVDVQTLRVDRFNDGAPQRCILVYSGVHYDAIALSPSEPPYRRATATPEFDVKMFDTIDDAILIRAVELCKILQGQHYFTDTAAFSVQCNICGRIFTGEKGAVAHAQETGHYDFGEGS